MPGDDGLLSDLVEVDGQRAAGRCEGGGGAAGLFGGDRLAGPAGIVSASGGHGLLYVSSATGIHISEDGGKKYALRWTALDPKNQEFEAFFQMNRARNWDDFQKALRNYGGATQNRDRPLWRLWRSRISSAALHAALRPGQ